MAWYSWLFGAYDGANPTRHRVTKAGVVSHPTDEDRAVTNYGREALRLECRDLARNDAVVSGICGRFVDNVVGTGLFPQAKTSSDDWNRDAEGFFRSWSMICDYRGRNSLMEMCALAVRAVITDGECGYVLVNNGQIQAIEAERIRTPNDMVDNPLVVDGIRTAKSGRILGYYVHYRNERGLFDGNDYRYILAEDFIHLTSKHRTDQLRGIPELAPVINALKDLGEGINATLAKWKNEAKMFYTVENEGGAPNIVEQPRRYNTDSAVVPALQKVNTGEIHYLRKGERLNPIESKTPSSNFSPFTERILRMIGTSFGLPYEFVLLDFSMGSYSSSRAALLQTFRTFEQKQMWLINGLLQRLWNWRIAKAINDGTIPPAPVDGRGVSEWYKVRWQRPEFGWVDPQSEHQGHILAINAGASTLTEWTGKRGRDAEDVLDEKGQDILRAMKVAQRINAEMPDANLTWRDLIVTNLPGQLTKQDAKANPTGENNTDDDDDGGDDDEEE